MQNVSKVINTNLKHLQQFLLLMSQHYCSVHYAAVGNHVKSLTQGFPVVGELLKGCQQMCFLAFI